MRIIFWKLFAKIIDRRPRIHLPKYSDYPIAETEITKDGKYTYPEGTKVLFEWDECGKHWIVFKR